MALEFNPSNHPAHSDLEPQDASRILHPPGPAFLAKDNITGGWDMDDMPPPYVLTPADVNASPVVQECRSLRSRSINPEEKLKLVMELLNRVGQPDDSPEISGEVPQEYEWLERHFRLQQYEMGALRKLLNELVPVTDKSADILLRAIAKGEVEHHSGLIFEALSGASKVTQEGASVAELILPLLEDDSGSHVFNYLRKAGASAMNALPALFSCLQGDKRNLEGALCSSSINSLHAVVTIRILCDADPAAALTHVRAAFSEGSQGVKTECLELIRKYGWAPLFESEIGALLDTEEKALLKEAILTLGHLETRAAHLTPRLLAIAEGAGEAIASASLYALGFIGTPRERILSAFKQQWGLVSETEPAVEEGLDEDSGRFPKTVRIALGQVMRDFEDSLKDPGRGLHRENVGFILRGLVRFAQSEPRALELVQEAWRHPAREIPAALFEALPDSRNFEFARPFLWEALERFRGGHLKFALIFSSFGSAGIKLLEEKARDLRAKIGSCRDEEERERYSRALDLTQRVLASPPACLPNRTLK